VSAIGKILDRVVGVKQTAPGRWMARCPAHEDQSPSLSIREMQDGRILLNCFASCPTGDVLAKMGLRMSDLFDGPIAHHLPPVRGAFSARELLELVNHEICVAALIVTDAEGRPLTPDECERLRQASARIADARVCIHG
jgi:hypothetical protein